MRFIKTVCLIALLPLFMAMHASAQQFYPNLEGWKKGHAHEPPGRVVIIGFITQDCINCYANFNPVLKAFFASDYARRHNIILLAPAGVRQKEYLAFITQNCGPVPATASFVINSALYKALQAGINETLYYVVADMRKPALVSQGSLKNLYGVERFQMLFGHK